MKKVLFIPLMFLAFIASAQENNERKHAHKDYHEMSNEQKALLKVKRMTLALDLSKKQQDEMESLQLSRINQREQLREERQDEGKERSRESISPDELFAYENQRLDQMIAYKKEVKDILSADQYSKWEEMHQKSKKVRHHNPNRKKEHKQHGK